MNFSSLFQLFLPQSTESLASLATSSTNYQILWINYMNSEFVWLVMFLKVSLYSHRLEKNLRSPGVIRQKLQRSVSNKSEYSHDLYVRDGNGWKMVNWNSDFSAPFETSQIRISASGTQESAFKYRFRRWELLSLTVRTIWFYLPTVAFKINEKQGLRWDSKKAVVFK